MKLIVIIAMMFLTFHAFAAKNSAKPASKLTPVETCFKAEDSLDREFCIKKRMKIIDEEFQATLAKYKDGISQAEKDQVKASMNKDIEANNEMVKLLNDELKLKRDNLAKLDSVLSNEEKEKAEKEKDSNKQKEESEKIKKALKKIFK